jgi:hypothetical protein
MRPHAWSCYWLLSSGPIRTPYNVYTKLELCASWLVMEDPVVGNVPPRSRRFPSEKQGRSPPRATKRGQPTLHHAAESEKTPDPFCFPLYLNVLRLDCLRFGGVYAAWWPSCRWTSGCAPCSNQSMGVSDSNVGLTQTIFLNSLIS